MQKTMYAVLMFVGFLSITFRADAKVSEPPSASMAMPMPSVAPLFIESVEFSSVLNLVNELNTPLQATVEIYSLDGEKMLSKAILMTPYSFQPVTIKSMLISSGIGLELGSIRVMADHSAGLLAVLSLTHRGISTTYFDEELSMPSNEGSNVFRGVADDVLAGSPITAITSLSNSSHTVTVTCQRENSQTKQRSFELGPNQTLLIRACSDDLPNSLFSVSEIEQERPEIKPEHLRIAAGIAISSDAMPGEVAVYGIMPHRYKDLFFTSVNFTDPKTRQSSGMAYVGIPKGPSALLPEGNYMPEIAVSNFSQKTATITLESATTRDATQERKVLARFLLAAGSTRTIQLRAMPRNADLTNSLLIRTDASPGHIMSKLVSHGNWQLPAVEMIEKDEQNGDNAGGHPWSIEPGVTSTLLLFNHDSRPQKVNLRFGTPSGPWMKKYTLNSMETLSIAINELIRNQENDDSGHPLAVSDVSGEVGWQADSSLVTGRVLQTNPVIGMARNFSCSQWVYACAYTLSPNPSLLLYLNNTGMLSQTPQWSVYTGFHPPTSCSCGSSTGSSMTIYDSWSSGNSSIANITAGGTSSTSTWHGAGAGSTTSSFAGTQQFSSGSSLTCYAAEPAKVRVPYRVDAVATLSQGQASCLPPAAPNGYLRVVTNQVYDNFGAPYKVAGVNVYDQIIIQTPNQLGLTNTATTPPGKVFTDSNGQFTPDDYSVCSTVCYGSGVTDATQQWYFNGILLPGPTTVQYSCSGITINGH